MGFIMTSSYMYDVITPLTSFCAPPNTLIFKKINMGVLSACLYRKPIIRSSKTGVRIVSCHVGAGN